VAGNIINCPPRHERIEVLISAKESNGNVFRYNHYMEPKAGFQTEHIHMKQHEYYEVISGTAVYEEDGVEKTAKPGDIVILPAGIKHVDLWNRDGTVELHVRREFVPSLGIQVFIETWFGLVSDDKHINERTLEMNLIQQSTTARVIRTETYLAGPPIFLQRLGIPFGALIGKLRGYKPYYAKYSELPPYIPPE
jgi:hypothetical protein